MDLRDGFLIESQGAKKQYIKSRIEWSARAYLKETGDWVTANHSIYGMNYYHNNQYCGRLEDPSVSWASIGLTVLTGSKVSDLVMSGRITDKSAVSDLEISVHYVKPANGSYESGISKTSDIESTEIYRGLWMQGDNNGLSPQTHDVTSITKRKIKIDFDVPSDGELRIYFKPVNVEDRPTGTDYFYYSAYFSILEELI